MEIDKLEQEDLPVAIPILPKSQFDFRLPPRCPLDNINFVQLRRIIKNEEQKE